VSRIIVLAAVPDQEQIHRFGFDRQRGYVEIAELPQLHRLELCL